MNNDLRPYMPTHPGEVLKDDYRQGESAKRIFFIDRMFLIQC